MLRNIHNMLSIMYQMEEVFFFFLFESGKFFTRVKLQTKDKILKLLRPLEWKCLCQTF